MNTFDDLANSDTGHKVAAANRRVEPRGGYVGQYIDDNYRVYACWGLGLPHLLPLLSGLLVSLIQPVYSIVTLSPALGTAPLPSTRVVLVTAIVMFWYWRFLR